MVTVPSTFLSCVFSSLFLKNTYSTFKRLKRCKLCATYVLVLFRCTVLIEAQKGRSFNLSLPRRSHAFSVTKTGP